MVASDPDGAYIADRVLAMMRLESAAARTASPPLHSRTQCLAFLGSRFRRLMRSPARLTDVEAGERLIRFHVLVHLSPDQVRRMPIPCPGSQNPYPSHAQDPRTHTHPMPTGPSPHPLSPLTLYPTGQADQPDCGKAMPIPYRPQP